MLSVKRYVWDKNICILSRIEFDAEIHIAAVLLMHSRVYFFTLVYCGVKQRLKKDRDMYS